MGKNTREPEHSENQVSANPSDEIAEDSQWYASYSLDTDKVTIKLGVKDPRIIEITESADIESLANAVDFTKWEYAPLNKR